MCKYYTSDEALIYTHDIPHTGTDIRICALIKSWATGNVVANSF
jgi:hypothetical protein